MWIHHHTTAQTSTTMTLPLAQYLMREASRGGGEGKRMPGRIKAFCSTGALDALCAAGGLAHVEVVSIACPPRGEHDATCGGAGGAVGGGLAQHTTTRKSTEDVRGVHARPPLGASAASSQGGANGRGSTRRSSATGLSKLGPRGLSKTTSCPDVSQLEDMAPIWSRRKWGKAPSRLDVRVQPSLGVIEAC